MATVIYEERRITFFERADKEHDNLASTRHPS